MATICLRVNNVYKRQKVLKYFVLNGLKAVSAKKAER